jgi:hypothetical protein
MSYSCSDFTDSILEALKIEVPEEAADSPSDQADLALVEIERLQRIDKDLSYALMVLADAPDEKWITAASRFIARVKVISAQPARKP